MSLRATIWAWSLNLPTTVKMVLLAIADKHNATTGDCYPSHALLVKMTGLSLSAVKIAIRKLDSMGLLIRSERSCRRSGRTVGVVYLLAINDAPRHEEGREEALGDHHERARGDHPYDDEQEKERVCEPRARKTRDQESFVESMERERNDRPTRSEKPRKSRFKSGALQLLEQMYEEDRQAAEGHFRREFKGDAAELLAESYLDHRRTNRFKSGAARRLQEIADAEQAGRYGQQKRYKSGALRRLQEIQAEKDRMERESALVVDADYWTQEDQ